MVNLLALQLNSASSVETNLLKVEALLQDNAHQLMPNSLLLLPECFAIFGCSSKHMLDAAESSDSGIVNAFMRSLSKQYRVFIVAGSHPLVDGSDTSQAGKYSASSLVYSPDGNVISHYQKMHLFDVEVADNTKQYRESASTVQGQRVVCFNTPWGRVGQSICYDLRFPELYRAMKFPEVVVVPSAFTKVTGNAHWHTLLAARAIENQCYVVAANQVGKHDDKRETFGNSCIYSPWGECLDLLEDEEGIAVAEFDSERVNKIRREMPIASHRHKKYE